MTLPRLVLTDGALEALKWLGLLLMTGDHVNKYLFNGTLPLLFEAGRLAMPLFAFVLAYNLARPGTFERGVYQRMIARLTVFGILASVPFIALGGLASGWWPLNILFTLLVLVVTLYMIERGTSTSYVLAAAAFLIGGSSVEFWWPALGVGLGVWWYCKRPSWAAFVLALLSLAALRFVSGNWWALAALPVIIAASHVNLRVPRLRWFFYAYYPAHLVGIWLIRIPMSKAGYLFF